MDFNAKYDNSGKESSSETQSVKISLLISFSVVISSQSINKLFFNDLTSILSLKKFKS